MWQFMYYNWCYIYNIFELNFEYFKSKPIQYISIIIYYTRELLFSIYMHSESLTLSYVVNKSSNQSTQRQMACIRELLTHIRGKSEIDTTLDVFRNTLHIQYFWHLIDTIRCSTHITHESSAALIFERTLRYISQRDSDEFHR